MDGNDWESLEMRDDRKGRFTVDYGSLRIGSLDQRKSGG